MLALRASVGTSALERPGSRPYSLGGAFGESFFSQVSFSNSSYIALRGYNGGAFEGDHYTAGSAEYRFPLWAPERGWDSFPLLLERFSMAAFMDVGTTWDKGTDPLAEDVKFGVGAELRVSATIGYYIPISGRIGAARGLSTGGINQFILLLGTSF